MKIFSVLLLLLSFGVNAQSVVNNCSDSLVSVGLPFSTEGVFNGDINDSQSIALNTILNGAVTKYFKSPFRVVLPENLGENRRCVDENKYVVFKLNKYTSYDVSDTLVEGTLDFTVELYRNINESTPYRRMTIISTGKGGRTLLQTVENAARKSAEDLFKRLKSKK